MTRATLLSFRPARPLEVSAASPRYASAPARFVRLRNGRRSVCFGCEQPAANQIAGEDVGAVGGPQ